jgi:hypothetical protein
MKTSPLLTAINLMAAALFAVFAWLQRNDIDPAIYDHPSVIDAALWLIFYLFISLLFVVILFRRIPRWLLIIGIIACFIEMGRTGPGLYENLTGERSFSMAQTSMTSEDPRVELTREFFGAMIALAGVGGLFLQERRRSIKMTG